MFGSSTFGQPQQNTSSIFGGAQQNAFGSPNQQQPASGSIFGGGQSPSQSSFGFGNSLSNAQKPIFGAQPTFGVQPAFGGAPSFSSPKPSFGMFSQTSPQQSAPTQSKKLYFNFQFEEIFNKISDFSGNTLFEQLGSSSSFGMTFGNLAQTSPVQNQPPPPMQQQQQPQQTAGFAGSAFSSWR